MIKVIDNVVGSKYQESIESTFYSHDFLWKCNPNISGDKTNEQFGLTHQLFLNMNSCSPYSDFILPLVYEISEKSGFDFRKIHNARSFLQIPSINSNRHDVFHVDLVFPHLVFLYYVNDSDGNTTILNRLYSEGSTPFLDITNNYSSDIIESVEPKRGRVVIFDGMHYHAAGVPKHNYRCVLNFNLIL